MTVGGTRTVRGGTPLRGAVTVPGDKSISHRALLLGALAEGTSTVTGLSDGDDVHRTATAVATLGASVERDGTVVAVTGGRDRLGAPAGVLDLGNSGTGLRLLLGVVATVAGTTRLTGDDSLRSRPMDRVAEPLGRMGAVVTGRGDRCTPPVTVRGGPLVGIEYAPPMASAQVKSAVLLAGLAAEGETVVHEAVATRAHTEEMLAEAGVDVTVTASGVGRTVRLRPGPVAPHRWAVPGDPSQAAFWVVAGAVVAGSRVTVPGVHLAPERSGFLGVLARMGADLVVEADGTSGSVTTTGSPLVATEVDAAEIPSLDEVPVLAVAALVAEGTTRFRDVGELRWKESDRLEGTAALVRAFGGRATVDGDDLVVVGRGGPPVPGELDARGDHRMAMAAAVAGAACAGTDDRTTVHGWDAVATSYPAFADDLARLGGVSADDGGAR